MSIAFVLVPCAKGFTHWFESLPGLVFYDDRDGIEPSMIGI